MVSTREIGGLMIPKQYRRRAGLTAEIKLFAIDIETVDGKAVLMCDSEGNHQVIKSFDDCISMLTKKKYRSRIGLFYNLSYDITSILKLAPINCQRMFFLDKKLNWRQKYLLKYIPRKQLTITAGHHTYRYQDLYQFYEQSLEEASRGYL